jgi:hypothetical protein
MSEKILRKDGVLAEGEATGHSHEAVAEDVLVYGEGVDREMKAPTGTKITHQEHKTIEVPPGDYVITRQREIDPDLLEARHVSD